MAFPAGCYPRSQKPLSVPFVGVLDGYEGLTLGAWSLVRRLLASYTGALIRIRRVTDDAEQDFGPLANGRLDVSGILTFLAGGACKVVTVYDQIGSNNWTQSTAAAQPAWVESLSEFDGAPAMNLDGSAGMECGLDVVLPYSILLTECNPTAATVPGLRTLDSDSGNRLISASRLDAGQAFYAGTIAAPLTTASAVCEILTAPNGGNFSFYSNGVDLTTGSISAGAWDHMRMGVSGTWHEPARSHVAEMAVFNTALRGAQVTALQAIFNPATL